MAWDVINPGRGSRQPQHGLRLRVVRMLGVEKLQLTLGTMVMQPLALKNGIKGKQRGDRVQVVFDPASRKLGFRRAVDGQLGFRVSQAGRGSPAGRICLRLSSVPAFIRESLAPGRPLLFEELEKITVQGEPIVIAAKIGAPSSPALPPRPQPSPAPPRVKARPE